MNWPDTKPRKQMPWAAQGQEKTSRNLRQCEKAGANVRWHALSWYLESWSNGQRILSKKLQAFLHWAIQKSKIEPQGFDDYDKLLMHVWLWQTWNSFIKNLPLDALFRKLFSILHSCLSTRRTINWSRIATLLWRGENICFLVYLIEH